MFLYQLNPPRTFFISPISASQAKPRSKANLLPRVNPTSMPELSPIAAPNSTRSKLFSQALTCASFDKPSGDDNSTKSVDYNLVHRIGCENCFAGESPSNALKCATSFRIA